MPVACLWGKAFNIPLSTLQFWNVHALFLWSSHYFTVPSPTWGGSTFVLQWFEFLPNRLRHTGRVVQSMRNHPSPSCNRPDPRARRSSISLLLQPSRGRTTPCGRLLFTFRRKTTPAQQRADISPFFLTRQPSDTTARFAQWIWQSSWCAPACAHSTNSPTSTSATFSSLTPWSSTQRRLRARSRERAMYDLLNHCYQAARR